MSKISELSNGGALLATDDLIVVRSGGNVRAQLSAISGQSVSATTLAASGATTLSSTLAVTGTATLTGAVGINIAPTSYKLTVNSGATTETTAAAIGYNGDEGTTLYVNTDHGNNLVSLYASGSASKEMRFLSGTLEVMRLDTTGKVGIGSGANPISHQLVNYKGGANANYIQIANGSTGIGATNGLRLGVSSAGLGEIYSQSASPTMTFSSGNVGIGVSAPTYKIDATTTSGGNGLKMARGTNSFFEQFQSASGGVQLAASGSGAFMAFRTGTTAGTTTEAYRITAGRDMYFGQTSGSAASVGHIMQANGIIFHTADGAGPLQLRRLTSDGPIAELKINASLIGVIAGHNGDLHIGTGTCGVRFLDSDPSISPYNPTTGDNSDNSVSLGRSNVRYTVVYATTGSINTSDRNLKQDIEELSDAEKRVAVAAKGLLRKFRWKDAVAEKGDNARIHFGIIAQDLQDAFTAEGLDAAKYGMWCSDTFTDEDTGEERTRLGVRYSELLAFIISAL